MRILFVVAEGSGLGHLRRLSLIACMLNRHGHETLFVTGHRAAVTVLEPNIEFIKIPSTNQLITSRAKYWGRAPSFQINSEELADWRRSILQDAVSRYQPNVIAVDHRPFGRKRELVDLIGITKAKCVLFLRGVLGEESEVVTELGEDFKHPFMEKFCKIFVCCDKNICNVSKEYPFLRKFEARMEYLGFIAPQYSMFIEDTRRERLGINHNKKKWVVISNGGGKYYSLDTEKIAYKCAEIYPSDWIIDVIFGPYSPFWNKSDMPVRYSNIHFYKTINNLSEWHQACDIIITPGGLNTILEGIVGNTKIIPLKNKYNSEISILCERLSKYGYCYRPISVDNIDSIMTYCTMYPVRNKSLKFCQDFDLVNKMLSVTK